MEQIEPNADAFIALRQRLLSGAEKPSPNTPAYQVAGNRSVFVRTSPKRITLVRRQFVEARRYTTYFSLGHFGAEERITDKKLEGFLNASGVLAEELANRTRGQGAIRKKLYTCGELYEAYIAIPRVAALRTFEKIKATIPAKFLDLKTKDGLRFRDFPPSHFTDVEALEWINEIHRRHGTATAISVRQQVVTMFNKCRKAKLLPADKMFPMIDRDILPKLPRRSTRMTKGQLKQLWRATLALPERDRDLIQVLLFTAQRVSQIINLQWAWIDLEDRVIRFPAATMKMGRPYECPITDPVFDILTRRKETATGALVFPTKTRKPIDKLNFSRIAERLDCNMSGAEFLGTGHRRNAPFKWCFHDFRRTAQSLIAGECDNSGQRLTLAHKKALIAHKLFSSGDAFQSYEDEDELILAREASETLAREILKVVAPAPETPPVETGAKIIQLRRVA